PAALDVGRGAGPALSRLRFARELGEELVEGLADRVGDAAGDRRRVGEEIAELRRGALQRLLARLALVVLALREERVVVEARDLRHRDAVVEDLLPDVDQRLLRDRLVLGGALLDAAEIVDRVEARERLDRIALEDLRRALVEEDITGGQLLDGVGAELEL